MKSIETAGKTVEDALRAGLKELGTDITGVTYEVMDKGSPGLFGMFGRLAKVRITVKEADADFANIGIRMADAPKPEPKNEPKPAPKPAPKSEPKPAPKSEPKPVAQSAEPEPETETPAPAPERAPRAPRPPRPARPERFERADRPERAEKPAAPRPPRREPRSEEEEGPLVAKTLDNCSEAAKSAYDFLYKVTRGMGAEVSIELAENDKHVSVEMMGDTLGILIGRRGDTLDALQYLTSLVVNKKRDEYVRVSLDTEHYRAKREEALVKLAERMAAKAQKTGRRVALEPMNPYERRILHSALQNHPAVTTHSEGDEPYRRVIITLK